MSPAKRGTRKGRKNYQKHLVLAAVAKVEPNSSDGWARVAELYKELSNEEDLREPGDLKRFSSENYEIIIFNQQVRALHPKLWKKPERSIERLK